MIIEQNVSESRDVERGQHREQGDGGPGTNPALRTALPGTIGRKNDGPQRIEEHMARCQSGGVSSCKKRDTSSAASRGSSINQTRKIVLRQTGH